MVFLQGFLVELDAQAGAGGEHDVAAVQGFGRIDNFGSPGHLAVGEFQDMKVGEGGADVRSGHVSDGTGGAMRGDGNAGALRQGGDLFQFQDAAAIFHVGHDDIHGSGLDIWVEALHAVAGLAPSSGHSGGLIDGGEVIQGLGGGDFFQPEEIERLEAARQLQAVLPVEMAVHIDEQIAVGSDHAAKRRRRNPGQAA